ncbi:hypothetical protein A20C1_01921 [marine actinobacterium PHSC20C1]|nr:hypothetical protein A20C1_01921 [marine actinobacterium PHSC20C1]
MQTLPTSSIRYTASDSRDPATLGFTRVIVPTALGDVVAHVNPNAAAHSTTATLLLHGAAGSWTTWLPLIRGAHASGKPLNNVVALDLPGWGDSGTLSRSASVEDMAAVAAHVARALGFTNWSIMGHSLGGHLALAIAVREPERTISVTAISATGPGALTVLRHPVRSFATLPWLAGMLGAMRFLTALGPAGDVLVRTLHRLKVLAPLSSPLFASPRSLDASIIDSLANEIRPQAFVRAAEAAARYDERAWSSIRCTVTIVRGKRDVFVSPSDDAWFAENLPSAKQRIAARAGHFAHIESAGNSTPARPTELATA